MLFGIRRIPNNAQEFNKGTDRLNRNASHYCYGLLEVNGKQIRRVPSKLRILRIVNSRLIEFRAKAERRESRQGVRSLVGCWVPTSPFKMNVFNEVSD